MDPAANTFPDIPILLEFIKRYKREWPRLQLATSQMLGGTPNRGYQILKEVIRDLEQLQANAALHTSQKGVQMWHNALSTTFLYNRTVNWLEFERLVLPHRDLHPQLLALAVKMHPRFKIIEINGLKHKQLQIYHQCLANTKLNLWIQELHYHAVDISMYELSMIKFLKFRVLQISGIFIRLDRCRSSTLCESKQLS